MNQKGQTIVQVMIGMALMGVAMAAFATMQSIQHKAQLNNQAVTSRSLLQLRIERYLLDSNALAKTVADSSNVALRDCYAPSGSSCVQTANPQGFYLIDSLGTRIAGAGAGSPVRYDYTGALCLAASPQCLFEVYTTYSALCPGGTSPCSAPSSLTATYTIQQAPGIQPVGGSPFKAIVSPAIPLNNVVNQAGLKAFVRFDSTTCATLNSTCTLMGSSNVASVKRVSTYNIYLLTFINPLANPNYAFSIHAGDAIPSNWEYPIGFLSDSVGSLGAGTGTGATTTTFEFGLIYYNGLANGGWANFKNVSVSIFGQ